MNPESFAKKLANIDCFKNRETLGRAVAGRVNLDGLISGRGKAMSRMISIANKVRICGSLVPPRCLCDSLRCGAYGTFCYGIS